MRHLLVPYRVVVAAVCVAVFAAGCKGDPEAEKREHFERGQQYEAEKKDEFAVIEYGNAVRIDPRFGEARYKLAQTHERMNNLRLAFPEYIRAADALPDNREVQIKATQILLLGGRFEDAKARATALVTKDPKDIEALLLRANAMAALKDPAGAITEIEEALKVNPSDSRAFVNLGAVRMQTGESKEAEAAFRQAVALQPASIDAHLALANYLWANNRAAEAEASIKSALAVDGKHLLANRMLGVLYIATQRQADAEAPLKVVADVSGAAGAKLQLADYYVAMGRNDDATTLLTGLAGDQSAVIDAESRLAALDYAQGRATEAHARLDALLVKMPNLTPALVMKSRWLTSENKLDEALASAKAAVSADAQSVPAQFALAVVHDRRREVAEAITAYTEVLRLNPRATAAQVELSRLKLVSGDREGALRLAEEAKQTEPTSGAARLAVARSLIASGDLARAETEIATLLKAGPNNAAVHSLDGTLQATKRNFEGARRSYGRALELQPGFVEALGGLTFVDIQTKQLPAARARVDAEIAKQPNNPSLYVLAAQIHNAAGSAVDAEQALRKAVSVDPRFTTGYGMLAQMFLAQKRLDAARAEFEGMVKRDPKSVGARTMVGVLLEAEGRKADARKWYEDTVKAVDNAPVVSNNLAFMYAEEGVNLDQALALAQAAKQRMPDDPDVNDTLGWVYYKKDMASLAIGPLLESIKARPNVAEVHLHLGLAYAKTGDKVRAKESLERAMALNPALRNDAATRTTLESVSR